MVRRFSAALTFLGVRRSAWSAIPPQHLARCAVPSLAGAKRSASFSARPVVPSMSDNALAERSDLEPPMTVGAGRAVLALQPGLEALHDAVGKR